MREKLLRKFDLNILSCQGFLGSVICFAVLYNLPNIKQTGWCICVREIVKVCI